ncbi:VCBS repeat-containing protein [Archangium sp.]|uniref:FG-GAP repeat domain-containing protein n=1 Tax=Archangium sp. TaxID=1872627 RepID=UPI002D2E3EA0|nr:VCBS repeat-containing protein [Archangium sp.]HYO56596.1 VCBS repeat-containing protein [Archangium sp.]
MSLPPLAIPLCALSAMLLLLNACEPDRGLPGGGGNPGGGTTGGGGKEDGGSDEGLVIRGDGGTFAAKPSCSSGSSCAGACPDGGVICAGNCGFLAPVTYPFAGDPKAIAIGDLEGDGDEDIVTANNDGRSVAVLLNQGSGRFQTPNLWWAGKEPTSVALADLDADAKLDLLVANSGDSNVGVYRGKGNGDFLAPVTYAAPGLNLNDLVVGEFGGGGKSVAILRGSEQKLSVFGVKSDGTLQTAVDHPASSGPHAMVVEDFNGDGKQDIAISYSHEPTCGASPDATCQSVGVLLGKGDGTFQNQLLTSTGGGMPRGLVAAKFDTDAVMDLMVADASRNQVLLLRGRGDGTFYEPVAYPVVKAPSRLVLADINRDTVRDVLVTSATGNQVSLLLGQPGGTFASQMPLTAWPQDLGLEGLTVSDFDKDGFRDMAVLTGSGIQMLWGICR